MDRETWWKHAKDLLGIKKNKKMEQIYTINTIVNQ